MNLFSFYNFGTNKEFTIFIVSTIYRMLSPGKTKQTETKEMIIYKLDKKTHRKREKNHYLFNSSIAHNHKQSQR